MTTHPNEPPPPDDRHAPPIGRATRPAPAEPLPTAMGSTWRALEIYMLTDHPPSRTWLLRHPTRDGKPAPPGGGDGLLPVAKVGLLVSDGGVGKTMALVALAVSVITGIPWLDHFHVPIESRDGKVLLVLGEEDTEEVWRRLYSVGRAYDLSPAQQQRVADQLVVLPLAGHRVALVGADGQPTAELRELVRLLEQEAGHHGWALIVLDPFSRFAGPEAEVDNAAATRTIQVIESLVTVPGAPTVVVAHHAPQTSLSNGGQVRARGVTGIRDAVRWEATLRADGRDVWFRQSKSNYSMPMHDELRLVRGPGGMLRAATEAEDEARDQRKQEAREGRAAERDAAREGRIARLQAEIVEALCKAQAPVTSQRQLSRLVSGTTAEREEAVTRLLAAGTVLPPSKQRAGSFTVAVPPGQLGLDLDKDEDPDDDPNDA